MYHYSKFWRQYIVEGFGASQQPEVIAQSDLSQRSIAKLGHINKSIEPLLKYLKTAEQDGFIQALTHWVQRFDQNDFAAKIIDHDDQGMQQLEQQLADLTDIFELHQDAASFSDCLSICIPTDFQQCLSVFSPEAQQALGVSSELEVLDAFDVSMASKQEMSMALRNIVAAVDRLITLINFIFADDMRIDSVSIKKHISLFVTKFPAEGALGYYDIKKILGQLEIMLRPLDISQLTPALTIAEGDSEAFPALLIAEKYSRSDQAISCLALSQKDQHSLKIDQIMNGLMKPFSIYQKRMISNIWKNLSLSGKDFLDSLNSLFMVTRRADSPVAFCSIDDALLLRNALAMFNIVVYRLLGMKQSDGTDLDGKWTSDLHDMTSESFSPKTEVYSVVRLLLLDAYGRLPYLNHEVLELVLTRLFNSIHQLGCLLDKYPDARSACGKYSVALAASDAVDVCNELPLFIASKHRRPEETVLLQLIITASDSPVQYSGDTMRLFSSYRHCQALADFMRQEKIVGLWSGLDSAIVNTFNSPGKYCEVSHINAFKNALKNLGALVTKLYILTPNMTDAAELLKWALEPLDSSNVTLMQEDATSVQSHITKQQFLVEMQRLLAMVSRIAVFFDKAAWHDLGLHDKLFCMSMAKFAGYRSQQKVTAKFPFSPQSPKVKMPSQRQMFVCQPNCRQAFAAPTQMQISIDQSGSLRLNISGHVNVLLQKHFPILLSSIKKSIFFLKSSKPFVEGSGYGSGQYINYSIKPFIQGANADFYMLKKQLVKKMHKDLVKYILFLDKMSDAYQHYPEINKKLEQVKSAVLTEDIYHYRVHQPKVFHILARGEAPIPFYAFKDVIQTIVQSLQKLHHVFEFIHGQQHIPVVNAVLVSQAAVPIPEWIAKKEELPEAVMVGGGGGAARDELPAVSLVAGAEPAVRVMTEEELKIHLAMQSACTMSSEALALYTATMASMHDSNAAASEQARPEEGWDRESLAAMGIYVDDESQASGGGGCKDTPASVDAELQARTMSREEFEFYLARAASLQGAHADEENAAAEPAWTEAAPEPDRGSLAALGICFDDDAAAVGGGKAQAEMVTTTATNNQRLGAATAKLPSELTDEEYGQQFPGLPATLVPEVCLLEQENADDKRQAEGVLVPV